MDLEKVCSVITDWGYHVDLEKVCSIITETENIMWIWRMCVVFYRDWICNVDLEKMCSIVTEI